LHFSAVDRFKSKQVVYFHRAESIGDFQKDASVFFIVKI
jgi:hypothetical protein